MARVRWSWYGRGESIDIQSYHRDLSLLLRSPVVKLAGEARAGTFARLMRGSSHHIAGIAVASRC